MISFFGKVFYVRERVGFLEDSDDIVLLPQISLQQPPKTEPDVDTIEELDEIDRQEHKE